MNDDKQFEKRLQRQSLREVPAAWREKILIAAREAGTSPHASPATRDSFLSTFRQQFSTLLWPNPRAWAGLAAAWVVILAVNVTSRGDSTPGSANSVAPTTPQLREMLREQEQMLAELFDQPVAVDRIKARLLRPQSFYRNECLNS
jgi:hypothetical protein